MKTKAKVKKAPARKRSTASAPVRVKKRVAAAAPRRKAKSRGLAGKIDVPATLKWLLGIGSVLAVVLGAVLLSSRSSNRAVVSQTEVAAPTAPAEDPNAVVNPVIKTVAMTEEVSVADTSPSRASSPTTAGTTVAAESGWQPFLSILGAMARPSGPTLGGRVDFWSELLLSSSAAHQKLRTLAANQAIDDVVPLVPPKFDCTTYVETVLSLVRSQRPEEFTRQLMQVRYRTGNATYRDRNHFPETDWLPNNTQAGVIKDITAEIGKLSGVPRDSVRKRVQMREWVEGEIGRGRIARSLASVSDPRWNTQDVEVGYLSMNSVARYAGQIPNGAIVNIVRKDMKKRPVLITHQGFVIQKDGKTLFRHANPGGQIRTEPLSGYLKTASASPAGGSILGLNINEIQAP